MNRTKVHADDLFFFDTRGETTRGKSTHGQSTHGQSTHARSAHETARGWTTVEDGDDEDIDQELHRLNLSESDEETRAHETDSSASESEDATVLVQLPEHSCAYCKIHDPQCVAKCGGCARWFCNGKRGTLASHLVNHLVKSGHKEVSLHPNSPVGDATLECYNCGCKNMFLLGYIQSRSDSVVVLLCRQPCAFNSPKDSDWDVEAWMPLISDRSLVSWLLQSPQDAHEARARQVRFDQIQKLETLWKEGRTLATLDDLDRKEEEEQALEPTKLVYTDAHELQNTMMPLVLAEAKLEKDLKEAQKLHGVTVRWDTGLNANRIAWFPRPVSESEFKVNMGDEVVLRHASPRGCAPDWHAVGTILDIPQNMSADIPIEIKPWFKCPTETTIGYSIEFVWNSVSFDRMSSALHTLAIDEQCVDDAILNHLLGRDHAHKDHAHKDRARNDRETLDSAISPATQLKTVSAPNLPELNHSQAHAVRCSLQRPLTLIQGPPGTGKTVTSATIVYHLAQRGPVLVVASSNVAVDHLTEKIHLTGLRVVRITAKTRETLGSSVDFLSLHMQARAASHSPELERLHKLRTEVGQLSAADEKTYLKLQRQAERLVLDTAQVVCCTCVGAGDPRVAKRRFTSVLIDEATQATEPEALIALIHGVRQAIMVGDHKQLGPVLMNKACQRAGFDRSLFERLIQVGIRPIRLQVQYRMHPSLSEFPSNMFYDGSLQNGVTTSERLRPGLDFTWPNPEAPMFLLGCFGSEELASSGTSYLNRIEAANVEKIVTRLLRSSVLPSQIGVITPYQGQRAYIIQTMALNGSLKRELYEGVEVASVDAFQGREKDYIILSCVRSNDNRSIGFVSDPRRMNVALTRARYGLIILGNPKVLSRSPLWNNLICHLKDLNLLMEGAITNMRPSSLHFVRSHHHHRGAATHTDRAINAHRSAFTDDDDAASLCSVATSLFYNDNLSQISQSDAEH